MVGLTTIAQPVQFLGQLAASQIIARIEKPESTLAKMKVPTSLVVRTSVKDLTK
jgi:DNA-binding LacI/PurR family transcriptional regulator